VRRQFQFAEEDQECLAARGFEWEAVVEANTKTKWLIVHGYPIPEGYNVRTANAALRIPPSYPDDPIDMVYFFPALSALNGKLIKALTPHPVDGQQYQQWSRHRTAENPWRKGLDNICTHFLQVDSWLERELKP
jgi:hypothetical protein